jgi:hypothetical protein
MSLDTPVKSGQVLRTGKQVIQCEQFKLAAC